MCMGQVLKLKWCHRGCETNGSRERRWTCACTTVCANPWSELVQRQACRPPTCRPLVLALQPEGRAALLGSDRIRRCKTRVTCALCAHRLGSVRKCSDSEATLTV